MNHSQEKLLFLCQFGNLQSLDAFINDQKSKLDLNTPNYFGQTPLMLSIIHGKPEITKFLLNLESINVNLKTFLEEKTAMMYAIEKGNLETVKLLVQKGYKMDLTDSKGKTCLIYSIISKNLDIFLEILQNSKDLVNLIDKEGKNSLFYVLGHHFYEDSKPFVDNLVFKGVQVLKDLNGKLPFENYSEKDKIKLVEQTKLKL